MTDSLAAAIALLAAEAAEAEPASLPALLGELRRVEALVWARLTAPQPPAPPPPSEAAPLTQEEAAERYRLPLRTLRFLTRTKRVPSYQAGRNRMVRPADLEGYLACCREQGVKVGTLLDVEALRHVDSRP